MPTPKDKFRMLFPDPENPGEYLKPKGMYRKALSLAYLQKIAPPECTVVGIADSQGNDIEDFDPETIEPGSYVVVYEDEDADYLNGTDTSREDVARAITALRHMPATREQLELLQRSMLEGNHDIIAIAAASVAPTFLRKLPRSLTNVASRWSYNICLTSDTVVVSIDCNAFEAEFLEFTELTSFESSEGQGSGTIHKLAHQLAISIPIHTLLSLCTSNTDVFDWKHVKLKTTKRRLIFTGISASGMVAHVAALYARELSLRGANV